MAYDEGLAARIRRLLESQEALSEKKMFGGLSFLIHGNMCCGVVAGQLVARVGKEGYADALSQPHSRPMDFTGKPLTGFVYVSPEGCADDQSLSDWLGRALQFVRTLPPK